MRVSAPTHALYKSAQRYDKFPHTPKDVVKRYLEWRDEQLYICGVTNEGKIIWWKAKKRGTKAYCEGIRNNIRKRIKKHTKVQKDLRDWKFLTLTVRDTGLESIKRFRHRWNVLLTNLRQRHPRMRIFKVYELQKRGSVHLHAIIWGIRRIQSISELKDKGFVDQWDRRRGVWKSDYQFLLKNWEGRNDWQTPRSTKGIIRYLFKYLNKAFNSVYVQAFMWFWRMRQWACTFPCQATGKTNSKSDVVIWGLGVCVLSDLEFDFNSVWCSMVEFLKMNGIFYHQVSWILKNIRHEVSQYSLRCLPEEGELRGTQGETSGVSQGQGAYEQIAGILRKNWYDIRRESFL